MAELIAGSTATLTTASFSVASTGVSAIIIGGAAAVVVIGLGVLTGVLMWKTFKLLKNWGEGSKLVKQKNG